MKFKSISIIAILLFGVSLLFSCKTKFDNNKFIGIWKDQNVTLIIEEDGNASMSTGRSDNITGLKWNQENDYIVIVFPKFNKKLFCRINKTGDSRALSVFNSDKFTELYTIFIRQ